jgi:Calpain family cysteine protease/Bacterial pre-peptidase C-terminal domain
MPTQDRLQLDASRFSSWSCDAPGAAPLQIDLIESAASQPRIETGYDRPIQPVSLSTQSTELGILAGTRILSDFVSDRNLLDNYRFSVASSISVSITLSGLSSDADIQLIRDTNGNGIADDSDFIVDSPQRGNVAELISTGLSVGTYFVQVKQFSGDTRYHLSISEGDWFSTHLRDAGLMGEARYLLFADGSLNRNDMITLLRETKDYGAIDAVELADLRAIVLNAAQFGMPESVQVLSNKVIHSDPANLRSGIGSLYANSSAGQLDSLINKWFLGQDRPIALSYDRTTPYPYEFVNGALFQNGISYQDIVQQDVSDCYFLSALGAVALRSPQTILSLFIDNGDDTYTVRFFNKGVADYVTVDRFLPIRPEGAAAFASWGGGHFTNPNNELWVALVEKAYAQLNESGWIGQDGSNSYNGKTIATEAAFRNASGINYGWPEYVLAQLTGRTTNNSFQSSNINDLIGLGNAGSMVALNTRATVDYGIVANHSYTLINYNPISDRFQLYNPWGNQIELTRKQISDNFSSWDYTTV